LPVVRTRVENPALPIRRCIEPVVCATGVSPPARRVLIDGSDLSRTRSLNYCLKSFGNENICEYIHMYEHPHGDGCRKDFLSSCNICYVLVRSVKRLVSYVLLVSAYCLEYVRDAKPIIGNTAIIYMVRKMTWIHSEVGM